MYWEKTKEHLRDLWDHNKRSNLPLIRTPEGNKKEWD